MDELDHACIFPLPFDHTGIQASVDVDIVNCSQEAFGSVKNYLLVFENTVKKSNQTQMFLNNKFEFRGASLTINQ